MKRSVILRMTKRRDTSDTCFQTGGIFSREWVEIENDCKIGLIEHSMIGRLSDWHDFLSCSEYK